MDDQFGRTFADRVAPDHDLAGFPQNGLSPKQIPA
jgi:hypothetical protein